MLRRLLTLLALVLLVGGTLAACGDDDDTTTAGDETEETDDTGADEEGGGGEGLVVVGTEYAFEAPDEIEGGVVEFTFRNEGEFVHEAAILGIGDEEQDAALEAFRPVVTGEGGAPIPDFIVGAGGTFELDPGKEFHGTQTLNEGRYLILCTLTEDETSLDDEEGGDEEEAATDDTTAESGDEAGQDEEQGGEEEETHFDKGMVKLLTVTSGDASADDLPAEGGTITAVETTDDAYTFETSGLKRGENDIAFVNDDANTQIHHVFLMEFPEGTTPDEAMAAFRAFAESDESGQPPPEGTPEPSDLGGTSVFDPGLGGTFRATLKADTAYLALCFINDREGGPPHFIAKGMAKAFTI